MTWVSCLLRGKEKLLDKELGGVGFTGSNLVVSDLEKFVDLAIEKFGRIDGVVNCTGHGPKGPVDELTDEDWHSGLDYYMLNVVRMTRIVSTCHEKAAIRLHSEHFNLRGV